MLYSLEVDIEVARDVREIRSVSVLDDLIVGTLFDVSHRFIFGLFVMWFFA